MWSDPSDYINPSTTLVVLDCTRRQRRRTRHAVAARAMSSSRKAGAGGTGTVATLPRRPPSLTLSHPRRRLRRAGSVTPAASPPSWPSAPRPRGWAPGSCPPPSADQRGLPARADSRSRNPPPALPDLYEVGWPDSPHRALRNSTATAWEAAGRPPLAQRPGTGDVIAHFASGEAIVRYEPAPPMTGTTGDIEALSMWAGQDVALARHTQSAADIVTELTSRL